MPRTYTLLIELGHGEEIEVGSLGDIEFPRGWYAYTGSAEGPGGYGRVDRHKRVSRGGGSVHWHVDYLNRHPDTEILEVVKSREGECRVAERIEAEDVPGFGSSDCGCPSHLHYSESLECLRRSVRMAHRRG